MIQKVLKVGSSAAVTIPSETLKQLKLNTGDKIETVFYPEFGMMAVWPLGNKLRHDFEIAAWTKRFLRRYRADLMALGKK
jgi:bifunctional DNA-binding transcriptional regulator/antitoxin component of YhaV-PrlF toxin-antitoxin module